MIKRHYRFLDHATVKEEITWKNLSSIPLKVEMSLSARMVHEEVVESGFLNPGVSGQSIAVRASGKHEKFSYKDVEENAKSFSDVKYAAFDDQFFLSAIVPEYSDEIDRLTIAVKERDDKKLASIDFMLKPFVLINGEERSITHQFFIGPKQIDLLASFSTPLDENIDFGWFGVLSRPMLWLLVQIYGFAKNYGLAIILITFIIKLLTYPLTHKSMSSQQEMKKLQPKLKELQQKYAHDRTLLEQKQMELYRSHGVNPVAGCLPLLIQLPIWFAFFQMLRNSVELFDQPFYGWITDLTRPDQYFVLPILMGVSMLVQQAFTPTPTDQPHMKYVMMGMPVFLTFIMLNMPAGLSLYILTNNLLTIMQQTILKKYSEKTSS
jgi:YidC/Oxa1 family membrane protein insertase